MRHSLPDPKGQRGAVAVAPDRSERGLPVPTVGHFANRVRTIAQDARWRQRADLFI